MKKIICLLMLFEGVFFSVSGQENAAAPGVPIDLVVVLDTSSGMSDSYRELQDYLTGPFLSEFLRIGDTFHLISFSDKTRVEIARRIEGIGDVETIVGRIFLMYPLGPPSDITAALKYTENYVGSLPETRQKKVLFFSDENALPGNSGQTAGGIQRLIAETVPRFRSFGAELQYVAVPLRGTPSSGRPPAVVARAPAASAPVPPTAATPAAVPPVTPPPATSPRVPPTASGAPPSAAAPVPVPSPGPPSIPPPATGTPPAVSGTPPTSGVPPAAGAPATVPSVTPPPATSPRVSPPASSAPPAAAAPVTVPPSGPPSPPPATGTPPATTGAPPAVSGTPPTSGVPPAAGASATVPSVTPPPAISPPVSSPPAAGTPPAAAAPVPPAEARQAPSGSAPAVSGRDTESPAGRLPEWPVDITNLPIHLLIGLVILAVLLLGLIIFLVAGRLHRSPNRAMAHAALPRRNGEEKPRVPAENKNAEIFANYAATQRRRTTIPPRDVSPAKISPGKAASGEGQVEPYIDALMLSLFVEDQNPAIGRRNIHTVKAGYTFTVGGGKSDFLIFLVPMPPHIAEIRFDGRHCTFIPRRPHLFPDIGSQPIPNCIGQTIRIISEKNYELHIRIERYEDPLVVLNRLLRSISVPG